MKKNPENLDWVKRLFDDPTRTIVFHNAKFDLKMFHFEGIEVLAPKAKVYCTLIMPKLFNSMLWEYSLRWLSQYLLNRDTADKDEIENWLKANGRGKNLNFSDVPEEIVKRRVLWDVESTILLFHFLYPKVKHACASLLETETQLMHCVIDMELTGMRVDITHARKLKADAERHLKILNKKLTQLVCPLVLQRKKKRKGEYVEYTETIEEFNPASPLQMPAAFEKLGITLLYKTKPKKGKKGRPPSGGGRWSFDEYAMIRYVDPKLVPIMRDSGEEGWAFDRWLVAVTEAMKGLDKKNWLMPLALKRNELAKMISTYYDHIIEDSVDVKIDRSGRETGTLHTSFNQIEAMSGRFSSSQPNFQNMPRKLGPRECFIPRFQRMNYHFDYEQVEMKVFVHFAKDDDMAEAIKDDIHLYVATQIYDKPKNEVTSEQRKRSKGVQFGILYSAGPPTMSETMTKKGLPTSVGDATLLCARYHRRFPSVKRTTEEFRRELHRKGCVTNPYGRRYFIEKRYSYRCLNYMCQGTAAEIMKRALVKVWQWLRSNNLQSKILATIHDEIVLEVPNNELWILPEIVEMMEDHKTFYVPITVGVEYVDKRWSHKRGFNIKPNSL